MSDDRTSLDTVLRDVRGFVFDLDGCVWNGGVLSPGAADVIAALAASGRRVAFITNNSRTMGADIGERLRHLGVDVPGPSLTPLEIIGETIAERFGPSRVLVIGASELAAAVARGGHEVLDVSEYRNATVVVVGNDYDFTYDRLTVAARAAAAGAPLVTPNLDPRLPIEDGDFLPGCGAIVQAVAVAAGVRPIVVGKPEPPLFRIALRRLGLEARDAAMVGDSVPSDMRGARAVGMRAVLYAPDGAPASPQVPASAEASASTEADLVVTSFADLARLAGVA